MNGEERRQAILTFIQESSAPVSGAKLASHLKVSRQVIVQDIALLRAADYDIISTSRGYLVNSHIPARRIFKVSHSDEQTEKELNAIIDAGGKVIDVFVSHSVYGELHAPLAIYSRRDVAKFIERMQSGEAQSLKNITGNEHFHTVEAYSEEILDEVEYALSQHGFLL